MARILIVDDQDDMRAGLRAMLLLDPGLVVAGDLSDGLQVVPFLRDHPVDLVLMDIRMPGIDGVEATRRIRKAHPPEKTRVIVLTTFDQDDIVLAALRAGANGFLSKTVSPAELVAGITEVVGGGGALSAAATAALIGHMTGSPPRAIDKELLRRFGALTPRARAVVILVASGLGNDEIAAQMSVSPYTVKTHAVRAMTKVGARDRATRLVHLPRRTLPLSLGVCRSSDTESAPTCYRLDVRLPVAITRGLIVPDVTCHMSISLDGFVAGPDQSREDPLGKRGRELHGWHIGDPRANDADKIASEWLMRPRGAYVMGRNMFRSDPRGLG